MDQNICKYTGIYYVRNLYYNITHPTQIALNIFLEENQVFSRFLKIIGHWCTKLITYYICSDLAYNKISKDRNSSPHTQILPLIYITFKPEKCYKFFCIYS